MFVQNTSSAVIDILTQVFPAATAIPLPNGQVQPSGLQAWEHYNQQVMVFRSPASSSDMMIAAGRTILQWCAAAIITAEAGRLDVVNEPQYLALEYLVEHGGRALARSVEQWADYQRWLIEEQSHDAFMARAMGEGRRDPSPHPISFIAPWPEYLGADLGGPGKLISNILRLSHDIIVRRNLSILRIGRLSALVEAGSELVAAFESAHGPSDRAHGLGLLRYSTETTAYRFRVQSTKLLSGEVEYVFRVLSENANAPVLVR
jgi:hypothetical protein